MEGTLWYEFSCGLRGFYVYSNIWKPKLNEKTNITHERGNMYDPNAVAGKIMLPGTLVASTAGHIPKAISRYTRYIVEHGASVDAFVLATHHRPSPLIQGGLEIPIKPVVKLIDNEVNSAKLQKYHKFVDENYRQPVDGKFADDTERILKLIQIGAQNAGPGEDDDDEDIERESDQ